MLLYIVYAALSFAAGYLIFWGGQKIWPVLYPTLRRRSPSAATPSTPTAPTKPIEKLTSGQQTFIVGLIVLMLGMGGLAWSFVYTADAKEDDVAGWPTAPGQITTLDMQDRVEDTDMSMVGNVAPTVKEVVIVYTYQVDGTTYTNDKIYFDERLPQNRRLVEPEDADKISQKYQVGKSVSVYYDPDDPTQSALERDENPGLRLIGLNAGIAFCLVAGMATRWLIAHR